MFYEISDPDAAPETAIDNGYAQQIFQSDYILSTTLNYDSKQPLLDKGKRYAFVVQAYNKEDKQIFRNDGKSKVAWFYYGYPENGAIELKNPANKMAFGIRSNKYFEWGPPSKLTPNQPITYKLKIVKLEGVASDVAIEQNAWYEENYQTSYIPQGNYLVLNKPMEPRAEYCWQVKTYSDDQMVAKSPIFTFTGPPIIEEFYAGVHKLQVIQTDGNDLSDLSGTAKISLLENEAPYEIAFNHLNIRNVAGLNVLINGAILQKVQNFPVITLKPGLTENKPARFIADSVRISAEGLELKGFVEWDYPIPVKSEMRGMVKSKSCWFSFNSLKIIGVAPLAPGQNFDLLEPNNFKMKLNENSKFIIYENEYQLQFSGDMELPQNVKGSVVNPVNIPFRDVAQVFYIISDTLNLNNNIRLIPNTCVDLVPRVVHIDLSDDKSPYEFSSDPSWKGIYFAKYDIKYPETFDYTHQISFDQTVVQSFTPTTKTHSWIAPSGLFLLSDYTFSPDDNGKFNTFPGKPGQYYLKVESSNIFSSFFKGSIKIPLISETSDFPFTIPISYDGFQTGYLDEALDGKAFVFNEAGGEEQKLNFTINRAVFSNRERLDLNVTIGWPFLNVSFKNLDGLKVYGNSEIGFNKPGGAASLAEQIRTDLKGYPITIDYIGCGRQANLYAFGTSAKIVMGEDVAGENGPPVANLYSIVENKLLTGQYMASANADSPVIPASNNNSSLGGSDVGAAPDKGIDNESQILEAINKVSVSSQDASSAFAQPAITNANNQSDPAPSVKSYNLTPAQDEKLKKVVYLVSKRLSEPLASKAGQVTGKIADELKSLTDTTLNKVRVYAHLMIDPIQKELTVSLGGTEIGSAVAEICSYTLSESVKSVTNALQVYLDTAIITPLRNSGPTLVYNTTGSALYSFSVDVLQNGQDFDFHNS
jgi:hypothetical protein